MEGVHAVRNVVPIRIAIIVERERENNAVTSFSDIFTMLAVNACCSLSHSTKF
jgi:hypothetical protein